MFLLAMPDITPNTKYLDIFNTDAEEQLAALQTLRPHQERLTTLAGGHIVYIFHTKTESARLYADYINKHLPMVDVDVQIGDCIPPRKPFIS